MFAKLLAGVLILPALQPGPPRCVLQYRDWLPSIAWGEITLADVNNFRLDWRTVAANRAWNIDHRATVRDEVRLNNPPDRYEEWDSQTYWAFQAWDLLDDAINPNLNHSPADRLQALYRLRYHIGDDAFTAGYMPSPIPHYRMNDRWNPKK